MNRRHFLGAMLPLLTALPLRAEMLKGRAAGFGERDQATWRAALQLDGLRFGKIGEQIQIIFFIDPNCPACSELWGWFDTSPRRDLASLWIPVAYMNKASAARAATLLRAPDPYAALAQNFRSFDRANWQGGIAPAQDATLEELSTIKRNTQFWDKRLFGVTPLMLHRDKGGSVWQTYGFASATDMDALVAQLAPARLEIYNGR